MSIYSSDTKSYNNFYYKNSPWFDSYYYLLHPFYTTTHLKSRVKSHQNFLVQTYSSRLRVILLDGFCSLLYFDISLLLVSLSRAFLLLRCPKIAQRKRSLSDAEVFHSLIPRSSSIACGCFRLCYFNYKSGRDRFRVPGAIIGRTRRALLRRSVAWCNY